MNKIDRILIFGASSCGMEFYKTNKKRYKVIGFIDNDKRKKGNKLYGVNIFEPADVHNILFDKIVIASDYHVEIYKQLINTLNIDESKISKYFNEKDDNLESGFKFLALEKIRRISMDLICRKIPVLSNFLFYFFKKNDASLRVVNYSWLDENTDSVVQQFEKESLQKVYYPKNSKTDICERLIFPEINMYHLTNGVIGSGSRSIIMENGDAVIERVVTSSDENNSYVGGQLYFHGRKSCIVRLGDAELLDRGIWISAINDTNYFHWVIEALSQFKYLNDLSEEHKNTPVLISSKAKDIPSIKAMLEQLYSGDIIYLYPTSHYKVKDLFVISTPNALVPNKRDSSWKVTDSYARRNSIFYLREIGCKMLSNLDNGSHIPIKKVFLARKGNLRKYNQYEVLELLSKYGFQAVYMEDYSFVEQISIMNQAEYIVGPTGAAWTNLIFANQNAKALCWMAEELGDISCFSNLAGVVGVDMDYIFYSAGTNNSRKLYCKEYVVDLNEIESWVSKLNF